MRYAVFNTSTGEIVRMLSMAPASVALNVGPGEEALQVADGVDSYTHWVLDGETVDRPLMPFSTVARMLTTADTLRIEDIPEGTQLDHPDGSLVVDDGFIEWDTEVPGHYVFTFRLFPYQEAVVHATVTDP